ncbi:MAG: protein translocase subunit SecF [Bacteroidota bacterium]
MRLFHETHIDFMGKRNIWYTVSLITLVIGLAAVLIRGVSFGIDFLGGTELVLRFDQPVPIGEIRSVLDKVGLGRSEIKTFGSDRDILIRTSEQAPGTTLGDMMREALKGSFPNNNFTLLKEDKIGPRIGYELRRDAIYAVIATLIVIMVYVGFRFKFIYGVTGVIALFHDVLVTFGLCALLNGVSPYLNLEMTQNMVAAFLTLIGFSINDTVIVFDRIRENLKIYRSEDLKTIMNKSINQTLSRTIITSGTVVMVLVVLLLFGGEVNRGFAFAFLIGTISGTYSSIYVASAMVLDWTQYRKKKLQAIKAAA